MQLILRELSVHASGQWKHSAVYTRLKFHDTVSNLQRNIMILDEYPHEALSQK